MITLNVNAKKSLNRIIWIKHVTYYRFPLKGSILFFPSPPKADTAAKGDMTSSSGVSRFIMTLTVISCCLLFAGLLSLVVGPVHNDSIHANEKADVTNLLYGLQCRLKNVLKV